MWFLSQLFTEGLLQKPSSSWDLPLIGPRPWRHMPRLIVMHLVFRSLLKIFVYAAKQACKLLQCNKSKLLEPVSINGLHSTRVSARASLLSAYTNENLGGHIYTVTQLTQVHLENGCENGVCAFFLALTIKICLHWKKIDCTSVSLITQ